MPTTHRRAIGTTKLPERLFVFVAERPRLRIILNAFGQCPVLKLVFGAVTRAIERRRSIRFTDFERHQIAAARSDVNTEYEASYANPSTSRQGLGATEISGGSQS